MVGDAAEDVESLTILLVANMYFEQLLREITRVFGTFTTLAPIEWIAGGATTLGVIHLVSAIIQNLSQLLTVVFSSAISEYMADPDAASIFITVFIIYTGVCWVLDTLPSYLSFFYLKDFSTIYNLSSANAFASNDPLIALSKF